eukprot:TRINITY_DN14023_c0_g1_i1.p1 TRINITY_DN14023_c0_g1~~TRINITY_DN14023_c0_g1_i1.p1  ORF type:complete len:284 (+),score=103.75 TRINITY_DN14023_c0_g1_i1:291-1142(+)
MKNAGAVKVAEQCALDMLRDAMQQKRRSDAADVALTGPSPAADAARVMERQREWLGVQLRRIDAQRSATVTESSDNVQQPFDPAPASAPRAGLYRVPDVAGRTASPAQQPTPALTPRPHDFDPCQTRSGLWSTVPRTTTEYVAARHRTLLRPDWNRQFRGGCAGGDGAASDRWWDPAAAVAQRLSEEEALRPRATSQSPPRGPRAHWQTGAGVPPQRSPQRGPSRSCGFDLWSQPPRPEAAVSAARLPEESYRDVIQDKPFPTQTGLWPTLGRPAHDRFYCKT